MLSPAFITGFLTSAGLLTAIGAQNAFVLRQGIKKEYLFSVSCTCFLCDIFLMSLGVLGVGNAINHNKILLLTITTAGVIFLLWYSFNTLKSAWRGNRHLVLKRDDNQQQAWRRVMLSTLAVTFLNPNTWLDTVVIIGGIASTFADDLKLVYLAGVLSASFIWFFSIGYLAALLSGYFAKEITWRILDIFIGCYMLFMAYQLVRFIVHEF